MIISASRRTDIPAFYHEWFMNRVRAGYLLTRNPFNAHQIKRVSLNPSDVDVIVFWTRNPDKIEKFLPELYEIGLKYYFQFTITGYPRKLEKSVPRTNHAIDTFNRISEKIGSGKVVWRYDPILLSNHIDLDEHKRLFSKIAGLLRGKTKRSVISFADFYKKTERNLKAVEGLTYSDLLQQEDQVAELVRFMSDCAKSNDMEISSCSESIDLSQYGIPHGKCIDDELIRDEFGILLDSKKDKGQREECGCIKSIDIGEYNTCMHGCSYCYATFSAKSVETNRKKHDPNSPFLLGNAEDSDRRIIEITPVSQQPLF